MTTTAARRRNLRQDGESGDPVLASLVNALASGSLSEALDQRAAAAGVANILSGNYCQPRCDEPTTEVVFTDSKEGRAVVIIAPVDKLGRRGKVTDISSVGTLESIITAVGPYITGDTIDADENVAGKSEETVDGKLYYRYELDTPLALNGAHGLAKVTVAGDVLVLFAISATDAQWDKSQDKLKTMVDSFRA